MIRRIALFSILILFCAQSPLPGFPPGIFSRAGIDGTAGPPPSFSGPVDVAGAAVGFWGLQAPSAADLGNKLINACNSTGGVDVACADMVSDASTGLIVPATIGLITCPGTNCTIKKYYDRSGNGYDLTQTTVAFRDLLVANCNGALPCAEASATTPCYVQSGVVSSTIAQPYTTVQISEWPGTGGEQYDTIFSDSNDVMETGYHLNIAAQQAYIAGPTNLINFTTAINTWHNVAGIYSGNTSSVTIDGSTNTSAVQIGTTSITGGFVLNDFGSGGATPACATSSPTYFNGNKAWIGIWAGAFSGTVLTNMQNNTHAFGWN